MKRQRSRDAFELAKVLMPGGVNSPARACRSVGAEPTFTARADGPFVYDVDGQEYVDLVGAFGPMILGHSHPEVVDAIREQASRGQSYGTPTEAETALAEAIVEAVPGIERLRLVNSGTEATMSALRVARGFTGRSKVVKFEGCYHGHVDALLVKAGSGAMTLGTPDSGGVTQGAAQDTLLAPFNDLEAVQELFTLHGDDIAAVILEPVVGNMGVVPPVDGFLEGLQELTRGAGSLLIFDEVMTGFRVAMGGAQERFGVTPDMTCLGKIVGGGLPVGVYGGRADIMGPSPEAPSTKRTNSGTPWYRCGAGDAQDPQRHDVHERAEALATPERRTDRGARAADVDVCVQQVGSMLTLFFAPGPVRCLEDIPADAPPRFAKFWRGMRDEGVMLPPSQYEAWFVSAAHDEAIIDRVIKAAAVVIKSL